MRFIGPFAADFSAALTDSFVAGVSSKTGRSTTLVVRVGVNGGHGAAVDTESVLQNLGDGREAVRGARGIRDHIVRRGIVRLVIYAENKSRVRPVGGRGDNHFFHRRAKVFLRVNALGEEAGRFHNNVRADGRPIDLGGVLHLENLKALTIHGDGVIRVRDVVRQIAEDGVVLQKVREGLRIGDVVDGDKLNVLVVERGAHDVASGAAEAVDADLDGHSFLRWVCQK